MLVLAKIVTKLAVTLEIRVLSQGNILLEPAEGEQAPGMEFNTEVPIWAIAQRTRVN